MEESCDQKRELKEVKHKRGEEHLEGKSGRERNDEERVSREGQMRNKRGAIEKRE